MSAAAAEDPGTPQTGYVGLLRYNVDFRRLWLGNVVSLLGDWFNTVAIYSLTVTLTNSPLALGFVFIAKMLPAALTSPIAGLLVDRFNRRRLMILSDLLRAVVVLGFLLVEDGSDVVLIYTLTVLQVVIGTVFQPAQSASLPNITTRAELLTANALMSATWSIMLAVGAGLGGFVTEWLSESAVFVIDSGSYLLSAYFIFRTRIPQATDTPAQGPVVRTAIREVWAGWRHVVRHPRIGRIVLAKANWAVAGGAFVFMLTLLGEVLSPTAHALGIGFLLMVRGLGTGIGPIIARSAFTNQQHWPTVLGFSVAFSGVAYLTLGLVPWSYWVGGLVMLAHTSSGANWVLSTVLLQERTEDRYRGRVFATDWLLVMLANTVSILAASLLLEFGWFDLRGAFVGLACVQVACGALWLFVVVPRERRDELAVSLTSVEPAAK